MISVRVLKMTYIGVISVKISCTDHNTINKWCSDATTVQKTGPHVEKRTETIGSHRNTTFSGTHFLRQRLATECYHWILEGEKHHGS